MGADYFVFFRNQYSKALLCQARCSSAPLMFCSQHAGSGNAASTRRQRGRNVASRLRGGNGFLRDSEVAAQKQCGGAHCCGPAVSQQRAVCPALSLRWWLHDELAVLAMSMCWCGCHLIVALFKELDALGLTASSTMAAPSASEALQPMCSNCHCHPIAASKGLCGFDDWCTCCDASLHAAQFAQAAPSASGPSAIAPGASVSTAAVANMCSSCNCRPVAAATLCGFDDWCAECDLLMHASQEYVVQCDRARFPRPPRHPLARISTVCPCGFFAIHNRPLAPLRQRPGQDHLPLHQLVTVQLTATGHITVCLICDCEFNHHCMALQHMLRHHPHFLDYH